MTTTDPVRAEATRLLTLFQTAGATRVEADVLQPADTLLDLYGEDIRARAFVTADPLRGEMMLRPDFTVPVVQMHMTQGADPARYAYAGKVFRRQEEDRPNRPSEYWQVGYEVFDKRAPAAADAEVFALLYQELVPRGLTAETGDIGLLLAAVRGLTTSDARKAALLRHIWRPHRFDHLLDRFSTPSTRVAPPLPDPEALQHGLRTEGELKTRIEALKAEAATPPIAGAERAALDTLLSLAGPAGQMLDPLRDLSDTLPGLAGAVSVFARRLDALSNAGIDVDNLPFAAGYGRTQMEYYDGFVFGFSAPGADLPPVASGGRYDALCARLGEGRSMPAVGAVVRPETLLSWGAR